MPTPIIQMPAKLSVGFRTSSGDPESVAYGNGWSDTQRREFDDAAKSDIISKLGQGTLDKWDVLLMEVGANGMAELDEAWTFIKNQVRTFNESEDKKRIGVPGTTVADVWYVWVDSKRVCHWGAPINYTADLTSKDPEPWTFERTKSGITVKVSMFVQAVVEGPA